MTDTVAPATPSPVDAYLDELAATIAALDPAKVLRTHREDTSRLATRADRDEFCPLCTHGQIHSTRRHTAETRGWV